MNSSVLLSEPKKLIQAIVFCLNQLLSQSGAVSGSKSMFDLKNKPTISFPNYLMRLFNFMGCSLSVYVYSLALIDKIQEENSGFKLTMSNVYRLLFTTVVVSTKYLDDNYFKNKYYASVGGMPLSTMNELQEQLLNLLNYRCTIDSSTFDSYTKRLQNLVLTQQTNKVSSLSVMPSQKVKNVLGEEQKHRKKYPRQRRERSRQKKYERNCDTQESRQIDHE